MKHAWFAIALVACGGKPSEKPVEKKDAGTGSAAIPLLPAAKGLPEVPLGLPPFVVDTDLTPNLVALGDALFTKLKCATCHDPAFGYAGKGQQPAASGKPNLRRAPTLVNLEWVSAYGWDGRYPSLVAQLEAHIRGQVGADIDPQKLVESDPVFEQHFVRSGGATTDVALRALAGYVETRYEGGSPWDKVERSANIPADLKAGFGVFMGKAQCGTCHTPPLYTDQQFHRLGLIALGDDGHGHVDSSAKGAFRTPTLRGVVNRRAGLFHDASAPSLDAAIDWHLAGGTGQGADPSIVDLVKITLTPDERAQLGAFVRALSK